METQLSGPDPTVRGPATTTKGNPKISIVVTKAQHEQIMAIASQQLTTASTVCRQLVELGLTVSGTRGPR